MNFYKILLIFSSEIASKASSEVCLENPHTFSEEFLENYYRKKLLKFLHEIHQEHLQKLILKFLKKFIMKIQIPGSRISSDITLKLLL